MNTFNRDVAKYYYPFHTIDVVAVYEDEDAYDNEEASYYEVYEGETCLNDGYLIVEFPTYDNVREWFVDITYS